MTTLIDGTVVDESINAANFTPAYLCKQVFGFDRVIESITIHHWGNKGQRFDDVVAYLASANARQSSAHVVVEAGRAASIVSPDDAAWHAGNAYGSATSIGIECRPEATDGDYRTVAAYVHHLRGIYGDLPLIPHRDWTTTACPGDWNLDRIEDEINALTEGENEMAISEERFAKLENAVKQISDALFRNDGKNGSIRGGLSVPELINTNDVLIRKDIADLRKALGK